MNKDQPYDAAEREMDLYRAEVTRITAERDDYAARLRAADQGWTRLAVDRGRLRDLLDEIGVTAANAPEDGNSFGVLQEIAMRIAAAGVPGEPGESS